MRKLIQTTQAVKKESAQKESAQQPSIHRAYIHYDPNRIDFTVTPDELQRLVESGQHSWREFSLFSLSIAVTSILNAVAQIKGQAGLELTPVLFLNFLTASVASTLSLCFIVLWLKSSKNRKAVLNVIERKPLIELTSANDDGGLGKYAYHVEVVNRDTEREH